MHLSSYAARLPEQWRMMPKLFPMTPMMPEHALKRGRWRRRRSLPHVVPLDEDHK
jgi:hypothetical protein